MKRTFFCFSFWLTLLTFGMGRVTASSLSVVATPGVITLSQAAPPTARYDFGVRLASDFSPLASSFTLRNARTASVTLTRIEPSCGCTTAVLNGNQTLPVTVGAGQTVSISVSINPGHVAPGAVRKTVSVYTTDDADHPAALLEIVGTIQANDTSAGPQSGSPTPASTLSTRRSRLTGPERQGFKRAIPRLRGQRNVRKSSSTPPSRYAPPSGSASAVGE